MPLKKETQKDTKKDIHEDVQKDIQPNSQEDIQKTIYNAVHTIPSLITTLGIRILPSTQGVIVATMPVDERTIQPYGFLSGGASLALAESLAGYGSALLCQADEFPSGMQVSANHLAAVPMGQVVQATATLLHKGQTTHIWNVDIVDKNEKLVSTARVTNMILRKKKI